MQVLQQSQRDEFTQRLSAHVRTCYDGLPQSEVELRAVIGEAIDAAGRYDIFKADDVRRYLECCLRFGTDFDHSASTGWAADILNTRALDGATKMDRIEEYELFVLKGRTGGHFGETATETTVEQAGNPSGG